MNRTEKEESLDRRLYSEELGIKLSKNTDGELFKWFLASILFGARIPETIAARTYETFEKYRLLDPEKILGAGWDFLVNPIMREGGYVRYDARTSTQVLRDSQKLLNEYGGSLKQLHRTARDERDLERKLAAFYGIGPVTVNIFLRELRPVWIKSNPAPLPSVYQTAGAMGIDLNTYDRKSLEFVRLEAGLMRAKHAGRKAA